MATTKTKPQDVELFTEILASDKLSAYEYFSRSLAALSSSQDPSVTWNQLFYNPWYAMAVYADMEEKDAAVASCLDARKYNVLSKVRNVLPASDSDQDKKIAEFVDETLNEYFCNFEGFLEEALDAVGKGVSIGEIIYADGKDRIFVECVKFKPQQLFSFGESDIAQYSTPSLMYPQTGPLRLRAGVQIDKYALGTQLPEEKFFVFTFRPKYGNRWGTPTDRKAFWQSWIKRSSIKQWLRYQEKGSGVVIARYNDGAADDEMAKANEAATAVQEESAVAIPKKFLLEVHEMVRNIGSSHKELVDDFCNAEITRIYLGQTLTSRGSDGGRGSMALGKVHASKEDTIAETDANALMQVVNQRIVSNIVLLNFGPNASCPKWTIEAQPKEDKQAKAKLFATAHRDLGIDLSKDQIYDDLQLEQPQDESDTLTAAPLQQNNNDPLDDSIVTEYSEAVKKKIPLSGTRLSSRTERFTRLRPSMIEFSTE